MLHGSEFFYLGVISFVLYWIFFLMVDVYLDVSYGFMVCCGINCDLVHNRFFLLGFIFSVLDWHILFTFFNKDAVHKDFYM
jgi:hypothetical protein